MQRDPALLFLFDARGSLPLSYVTKSLWSDWNEFLEDHIDSVFPREKEVKDGTPVLCTLKPDSRPVPDPKGKISPTVASQVANGDVSPYAALMSMREDEDDTETVITGTDYDSDEGSSYYSDEDSDFDSDMEEELLGIVGEVKEIDLGTMREN